MASSSSSFHYYNSTTKPSKWSNLPPDILITIANLLEPDLGYLRLRSVCHPWRSSLPTPSASSPSFPLSLPSPLPSTTTPSTSSLSLRRHTLFLISAPNHPSFLLNLVKTPSYNTTYINSTLSDQQTPNDDDNNNNNTLLAELSLNDDDDNNNNALLAEQTPNNDNNFTLFTPLSTRLSLIPGKTLNLLNFGVNFVMHSYTMETYEVFKKVAMSDETKNGGVIVVVGVTVDERLLVWKYGDENWTMINHNARTICDILFHDGKFYAITDRKGRLVVIDFDEKNVVTVVKCLVFGSGRNTSLVGCDLGLFIIDRVSDRRNGYQIDVYKLDEKSRFWDYEYDVNGYLLFLGDNCVNLWLSRNDYDGNIGNMIYFIGDDGKAAVNVWDMKKRVICPLADNEACCDLFSPPLDCFGV